LKQLQSLLQSNKMNEYNPISVILITSGSRGQRLLFRYPYEEITDPDLTLSNTVDTTQDLYFNPYRLKNAEKSETSTPKKYIKDNLLFGFTDSLLATMLAPKLQLCDCNFELTIEEIKFVGFPVLVTHDNENGYFEECLKVEHDNDLTEDVMIKMVHVVFVVSCHIDSRIVNHFQTISRMVGKSLRHEEKRCRYLSSQREVMISQKDISEKLPECEQNLHEMILKESALATDLVDIFNSMSTTGIIKVAINGWLNINYCLPHKIHRLTGYQTMIDMNKFNKFISNVKPYHTLLLTDESEKRNENFNKMLPHDASPALTRIIKLSNHIKSFQTLCQDADISLPQIFQVVAHLLYWGKCTVIYPLAESNVYIVSENAPTAIDSKYAEEFVQLFPKQSLHDVLAKFSFPVTLGEYRNAIYNIDEQVEQAHIVTWLLKHRLLKQLHTYVWIMPEVNSLENEEKTFNYVFSNDGIFSNDSKLNLKTNERRIFDKFSSHERRSLLKMASIVDRDDLSFFLNMSKYFRGEHHLEHIMYYENVPRSKLLILIDKFRSMLLTVQHEDAATSRMA